MKRNRKSLLLRMLALFVLPLLGLAILLLQCGRKTDEPVRAPQPWPFWNIGRVSGMASDTWPRADAAAIPVSPEVFLVPIDYMGEARRDPTADPRIYARFNDRVLEGEYLAASEMCGVGLMRVPGANVIPYALAREEVVGRRTVRVLEAKLVGSAVTAVNEPGMLCETLPHERSRSAASFRMSRCTVSTGAGLDGVALVSESGALVAVLSDNGDGYRKYGVNAPCLRRFLSSVQATRELFHDKFEKGS